MPLARIITKSLEESFPLQEQLRARGFEVHAVSPEQSFSDPADLEITLEELPAQQALARADELAHPEDLSVFIAPASFGEGLRPVTVIPIVSDSQQCPMEIQAAVPEAVAEAEPEFDPVAFGETEQVEIVPAVAAEALQQVALPEDYATSVSQELVADDYTEVPEQTAESTYIQEPVAMDSVELNEEESEPVPAQSVVEDIPAEEPVVLAPEVQEMIPELEAAMPDMEAWAREEGPVSDWPIWQAGAIDPIEIYRTAEVVELPIQAPAQEVQQVRTVRRSPFTSERVFWRTAAWAAMVALSALVLGATVHRFSPIPARFASSKEAVNQPVDAKPAPANAPVAPEKTVKPSAVLKRTAVREPRVNRSENPSSPQSVISNSHVARRSSHHASSQLGDELVAPDTVVRFAARPAPKVQAQVKSDGIKRYTDLK